ncbi:MAG: hypothetical protein ACYSR4_07160 [Planctomycetota bacterium]
MSDDIRQKALCVGFDLVGITDASPIDAGQVGLLADWLKAGYAGQMGYMRRNVEKRISPARLLEGAKSVVCVGLNYHRVPSRRAGSRAMPDTRIIIRSSRDSCANWPSL